VLLLPAFFPPRLSAGDLQRSRVGWREIREGSRCRDRRTRNCRRFVIAQPGTRDRRRRKYLRGVRRDWPEGVSEVMAVGSCCFHLCGLFFVGVAWAFGGGRLGGGGGVPDVVRRPQSGGAPSSGPVHSRSSGQGLPWKTGKEISHWVTRRSSAREITSWRSHLPHWLP